MVPAAVLVALSACSGDAQAPPPGSQSSSQPEQSESPQEELQRLADAAGVEDPPDIEAVRTVEPHDFEPMSQCMQKQGWPNTVSEEGVLFEGITDEQMSAFELAQFVCLQRYPTDRRTEPLTAEQLRALYAHERDVVAPCLREQGFDPGEAPSEETFVAEALEDPYSRWNPRANVFEQVPLGQLEELEEICPPLPPDEW